MENIIRAIADAILTAGAMAAETARRLDNATLPGFNGEDREKAVRLYGSLAQALVATAGELVNHSATVCGLDRDRMEDDAVRAFDAAFADVENAIDEALREARDNGDDIDVDELLASLDFKLAADEDVPPEER